MKLGRVTLLILLMAGAACADYEFLNLSEMSATIGWTDLAVSPEGVIVAAWTVQYEGVYTRTLYLDMIEPPVYHGPGSQPTLCWAQEGFTLVYADGTSMVAKVGDGFGWSDPEEYTSAYGSSILRPQLTGCEDNYGGATMLGWQEGYDAVLYSMIYEGDWLWPNFVNVPQDYGMGVKPQLMPTDVDEYRVYQLNENLGCIDYYQGGYGFIDTYYQIHPDGFWAGTDFDVCVDENGMGKILSNGPQPVCPCNILMFSEEITPHVWSDPVDLTIPGGAYNWPEHPCIELDSEGRIYLFWRESFYDDWLEQTGEGMYCYTREPGSTGWTDVSATLEGEVGSWCAMELGPYELPVFLYTKGEYQATDVWVGRDIRLTEAPAAPASLRLSAAPNPFNPKTTLSFELPAAGLAELSVFDPTGRRVATLLSERRDAGEFSVEWDGRDDAGARLASGVYMVRATVPGYSATEKVVMLK